jgi:hypothetical protein
VIDMRTVLGAVAFMTLTAGTALAVRADRDGDGRITRAELAAVHATLFEQLDANKDGVVTASEADPHFLDLADQNRDGQVTKAENDVYASEAAERDLAHCDANGDDALSGEEINCITSADSFNE